MRKATILNLTR